MVKASMGLAVAFGVLAVLVAGAFPILVHRAETAAGDAAAARRRTPRAALATAAWMAATFAAAASGRLSFTTVPPTMMVAIVLSLALALRIGLSGTGSRIAAGVPLALLVGVQGFRLPLELLMHRAYAEGVMPVQMSYSGRNFDIVTGTTAILLAAALWLAPQRVSPKLVLLWNLLGFGLLLNVLTIAVLSAPTPLRVFHERAVERVDHAGAVRLHPQAAEDHDVAGERGDHEHRREPEAHGRAEAPSATRTKTNGTPALVA